MSPSSSTRSNVFAILGLRALYIALAHVITELRYLHYGLAAVLAFAGLKMIVPDSLVHVPPLASAAVIVVCIGAVGRREPPGPGQAAPDETSTERPSSRPAWRPAGGARLTPAAYPWTRCCARDAL